MKRLLLALLIPLLISLPVSAALPAYTVVWEVEHAGNDTNGAGFDSSAAGTDMSQFPNKNAASCTSCQSATNNLSTTDLSTTTTGGFTATSSTAAFTTAITGNLIHLSGGTGGTVTTGWYEATYASATTITLDRSPGAVATLVTMNIGGALATLNQVFATNMALSTAPAVWVKSDATYSQTAQLTIDSGGTNNGIATVTGYTSSRGDGGKPLVQGATGIGGADNYLFRFSGSPSGTVVSNFTLDCNNFANTGGMRFVSTFATGRNISVTNCSDAGFLWGNAALCDQCTTTNTPAAGVTGSVTTAFSCSSVGCYCITCQALGSTVNSSVAFAQWCGGYLINSVAANFSGTTTDAVTCTTQESDQLTIDGMDIYGFTRDGIRYGEAITLDTRPLLIRNVLISNIKGYCFDQTGTLALRSAMMLSDHNGCDTTTGSPSGFYHNWPAGPHDVTLTASPFTAAGSNNFALNSTAGAGASAKAAGFPGVLASGTGYVDMGALQSQAGASSVTIGTPTVQ